MAWPCSWENSCLFTTSLPVSNHLIDFLYKVLPKYWRILKSLPCFTFSGLKVVFKWLHLSEQMDHIIDSSLNVNYRVSCFKNTQPNIIIQFKHYKKKLQLPSSQNCTLFLFNTVISITGLNGTYRQSIYPLILQPSLSSGHIQFLCMNIYVSWMGHFIS